MHHRQGISPHIRRQEELEYSGSDLRHDLPILPLGVKLLLLYTSMTDRPSKGEPGSVAVDDGSSELSIGISPFSKSKDLCAPVWQKLEVLFKHVKKLGLQCTMLSKAAIMYRDKHYYSIRR